MQPQRAINAFQDAAETIGLDVLFGEEAGVALLMLDLLLAVAILLVLHGIDSRRQRRVYRTGTASVGETRTTRTRARMAGASAPLPAPGTVAEALRRQGRAVPDAPTRRPSATGPLRLRALDPKHEPSPILAGERIRTTITLQKVQGQAGTARLELLANNRVVATKSMDVSGSAFHLVRFDWVAEQDQPSVRVLVQSTEGS